VRTREPVLRGRHRAEQQRSRRRAQGEEVPDSRAGGEQHAAREEGDEQRHGEMGLEENEPDDGPEDDDKGKHAVLEVTQLFPLLGGQHRAPHHDGEFRELGGLQREDAEVHPAPGAIDGRRDEVRERQQRNDEEEHRDAQQWPGPLAPAMVVGAGEDDRQQAAHRCADRLAEREARANLAAGHGHETRRAVHRGETENDQHRRDDREQPSFPGYSASTIRRNVAPRCS